MPSAQLYDSIGSTYTVTQTTETWTALGLVEAHWDGIIVWQRNRLNNGLLGGTSSLVQAAKRRACGYRSKEKMITIIYLIAGKLPLPKIHTI